MKTQRKHPIPRPFVHALFWTAGPLLALLLAVHAFDAEATGPLRVHSLLDSDHWFVVELYNNPSLGREWVWKAFCRGHHPILMEHLPPQSMVLSDCPISLDDPGYIASRQAMGQVRRMAERMDLAAMTPRGDLASSGYCLASPGTEYLIFQPDAVFPLGKTSRRCFIEIKNALMVSPASTTNAKYGTHPNASQAA